MLPHAEGNALGPLEVIGETLLQLGPRVGEIGTKALDGTFTTPAKTSPDLGAGLLGLHKQHKLLARGPMGQEQSHRVRLVKAGQIPKVAVLPERPLAIGVVHRQRGRRDHGRHSAQTLEKTRPTLGVNLRGDRHGGSGPGRDILSATMAQPLQCMPKRLSPLRQPSTAERCELLLSQWRGDLRLSDRERSALGPELQALDQQLIALRQRRLRIAVFGRVGVGKSSLLNALLESRVFATDVAHGCTRHQQREPWAISLPGLERVELVDTPGIDEIAARARHRLAARVALGADLVLVVLDGDLTTPESEAVEQLLAAGKPVLIVLNRIDNWPQDERAALIRSIRSRLPRDAQHLEILPVAAAPRQAVLLESGKVRSQEQPPRIEPLRSALLSLLQEQGSLLLGLNGLCSADRFSQRLHAWRLQRGKAAAQGLIGRYAALKATGVAANPLLVLDLAGGIALDTALVLQLCKLYDLELSSSGARALLTRLSAQNALLGGTQLGIQLLLGGLRQLLLLAAPFSGGLSLGPAAPVAMAQAALAVHTTRLTGRLAAAELLQSAERGRFRPASLLRRLAAQDPQVRDWLRQWQRLGGTPTASSALLP